MMTKKQYNILHNYEESFNEAKAGYYRTLLKDDVNIMADIYEALGYTIEGRTCNRCILTMLLNLAKEYDNYKNKLNKKNGTSI